MTVPLDDLIGRTTLTNLHGIHHRCSRCGEERDEVITCLNNLHGFVYLRPDCRIAWQVAERLVN